MPNVVNLDSFRSPVFAADEAVPRIASEYCVGADGLALSSVALAARFLGEQRMKAKALPWPELREPQWDLLLLLYIEQAEGRGVTIDDAGLALDLALETLIDATQSLADLGYTRLGTVNSTIELTLAAMEALTAYLMRLGARPLA